jgi:hypothetical protein
MSSNRRFTTKGSSTVAKKVAAAVVVEKPYCGACHKAGKTIQEYTSHWTRATKDTKSPITCPMILSAECSYCHKNGHWKKFCPVLLLSANSQVEEKKMIKKDKFQQVIQENKIKNVYDCLDAESEDETEVEAVTHDNNNKNKTSSWADILKREPVAFPTIKVSSSSTVVAKPIEIVPLPLEKCRKLDWKTPPSPPRKEENLSTATVVQTPPISLEKAKKVDWNLLLKKTKQDEEAEAEALTKLPVIEKKKPPFMIPPPILKNMTALRKIKCWADVESSDEEDNGEPELENYDNVLYM